MAQLYSGVLDQIARFFILLSNEPSHWFSFNKSCDHAFHISKQIGMDQCGYQALLIAGNLAWHKGGEFCILGDKLKSFIYGHHFIDLPSGRKFEVDRKRITID